MFLETLMQLCLEYWVVEYPGERKGIMEEIISREYSPSLKFIKIPLCTCNR